MRERPRTIDQILLELQVISHGATQKWNPSGHRRSADRNPAPSGEPNPPHDIFSRLYDAQWTDAGRERIRQAAEKALRELKHSQAKGKTVQGEKPEERNARIAKLHGEGWTWQDIANAENSTPTEVKKAAAAHHKPNERTVPIRELAEQTGLSRSRIHRMFPGRLQRVR
jgi:hypothetical protein